jgi:hypothetical protein
MRGPEGQGRVRQLVGDSARLRLETRRVVWNKAEI